MPKNYEIPVYIFTKLPLLLQYLGPSSLEYMLIREDTRNIESGF